MRRKRGLRLVNIGLGILLLAAALIPAAVAAPPKPSGGDGDLRARLSGVVDAIGYRSGEKSVYKEGDAEVPGEIIVRLKNRLDTAAVQAWAARYGARLMSSIDLLNIHQLKVEGSLADTAVARKAIQADPNVEYATPNRIIRPTAMSPASLIATSKVVTPNDPYRLNQWALDKEDAFEAWDYSKGHPQAVLSIIDTGIDYNHPDIRGKYAFGYDFANEDNDAMDEDVVAGGHGTMVAGKASAWTNNGVGIAGLSWYSILMAMKVCDANYNCTVFNEAKGIFLSAWIQLILRDQGFHVIANISLAGLDDDPTLRAVVQFAYNVAGILMVAGSGNTGGYGRSYPAAYPEVISVACTTQTDARCSFSTYHETVELASPGYQIYSTLRVVSGTYGYGSGTSLSAPDVSGIAALVWARWPNKTNAQVRQCLDQGVWDLGTPGRDQYFGFGLLSAFKAVLCAPLPTPTPTPTPTQRWRAELTWGATPSNLDTYLWLPPSNPYRLRPPCYGRIENFPYARLDRDDRDGYGPEIVTIYQPYNGSYRYAVRNSDLAWPITGSGAVVKLYQGNTLRTQVAVPTEGRAYEWWYVLDFNPTTGAVTVVNRLQDAEPAPYADPGICWSSVR